MTSCVASGILQGTPDAGSPDFSMLYAHSTERTDRTDWEPLPEHLAAVARLAAELASAFGAAGAARLAGLLHDLGKFSEAFQAYIRGEGDGVDHSTAGAREAMRGAAEAAAVVDRIVAELVAYVVAGHHAGLPDRGPSSGPTLSRRLDESAYPIPPLNEAWRALDVPAATGFLPAGFDLSGDDPERIAFRLATLGRMLFSCLVDADFLATERFYASLSGAQPDREWPPLGDRVDALIAAFDAHMDAMRGALPDATRASPPNALREEVLAHVRAQATKDRGVFRRPPRRSHRTPGTRGRW